MNKLVLLLSLLLLALGCDALITTSSYPPYSAQPTASDTNAFKLHSTSHSNGQPSSQDSQTAGSGNPTDRKQQPPFANGERHRPNCRNNKYGFALWIPQGWTLYTSGPGAMGQASCASSLDNYVIMQDSVPEYHNQINIDVVTAGNQSPKFWNGFDSLASYLKVKGLVNEVQSYSYIGGEAIAWLKPQIDADGQYIQATTYHGDALYLFDFYSVDTNLGADFVSSFQFLR